MEILPEPPKGDPLYYWRHVLQFFEMLGVVAAVILALWDKLRKYVFKPKLDLAFPDPNNPIIDDDNGSGATVYACDLRVVNSGRAPATGCAIVVKSCLLDMNGKHVPLARKHRQNPTPWQNDKEALVIHNGLPPTLRILTVEEQPATQGQPPTGKGVAKVLLLHAEYGKNEALVLDAGSYKLHLAVIADGGERSEKVVTITYDGNWHAKLRPMTNSLSIKLGDR